MNRLLAEQIFDSSKLGHNLGSKTARGGLTNLFAEGIKFLISIGSTIVLARLLMPEDFGLVGMAAVLVNLSGLFLSSGLSIVTIQKDHITPALITNLFWLSVLFGMILGITLLFLAPFVVWFYDKRELASVTYVMGSSLIVTGIGIQHQALLQRHMRFDALVFVQIIKQCTGIGVTIILAYLDFRYWALVIGMLVATTTDTILTIIFCPWLPGLPNKNGDIGSSLKFIGHLSGFEIVGYFSRNLDGILIGRFMGAEQLGFYNKAYQLYMMPITRLRDPITKVALPALSALKNQPERFVAYYKRLLDILASITIPLSVYFVIEADYVVLTLLGNQWYESISIFRILAISAMLMPVAGTRGLIQLSFGHSKRFFYWGIIYSIASSVSFAVGIPFGIRWVAGSYTIMNYLILIPSLYFCFRSTPVTIKLFLQGVFPSFIVGLLSGCCAILVSKNFYEESHQQHLITLIVFVISWGGLSWSRKEIRETARLVYHKISLKT